MLFGQTLRGRDLAPRLAFRLDTGLVMDCVLLEINAESKRLIAKRPVAGGNVLATYSVSSEGPQLATVRKKAMTPLERDENRQGEIIQVPAGVEESVVKTRLIERVKEESEGPDLETANIIVSGGRGIDSPEEFESYITQGLAKVLGAAVGGTRAAVDFGLISEQHQVGLTGKIVGPNLYFAVALSGATQHITGCSGSKHIVAINRDENAQIFQFAEFGIVGDYKKALPPLVEKLKEVMSG
jgi:electron transfer flavoprotein alpha subunit